MNTILEPNSAPLLILVGKVIYYVFLDIFKEFKLIFWNERAVVFTFAAQNPLDHSVLLSV